MGVDQIPTNHRMRMIVAVFAALVASALIIIGLFWARTGLTPAAGDTRPAVASVPSTAQPPSPSVPPAESTPAAQGATVTVAAAPLPASCEQLYSAELVNTLTAGNLALNPARLNNPGEELRITLTDEQLRNLLDQNESLQCVWTTAEGGSGVGIVTAVVLVDPAERDSAADRFRALGYNCFDERDGLRCETEVSNVDGTFGESHFLRDDLWLATQYGDQPLPEGYTLDIINNLWPLGK